jgi:hypothetical protein
MNDGKMLILGAALRIDKGQFRAKDLVQLTGLSRQLTNYHLKKLVDEGLVEQFGVFYQVPNKDDAIEALINIRMDKSTASQIEMTDLLSKADVDLTNKALLTYISFKSLRLPGHGKMRERIVERIDDTIHSLESARKYINSGAFSDMGARKRLKREDWEDHWKLIAHFCDLDKDDFEVWFNENVKDYEE